MINHEFYFLIVHICRAKLFGAFKKASSGALDAQRSFLQILNEVAPQVSFNMFLDIQKFLFSFPEFLIFLYLLLVEVDSSGLCATGESLLFFSRIAFRIFNI